MIKLLLYMNVMGSLFFVLHMLLFPAERKHMPPEYRVFLCRVNLAFFIVPFPVCLFYLRRYIDGFISALPVVPFVYSGSHVIVRLEQNVNFAMPKMNFIQIIFIIVWIAVTAFRYAMRSYDRRRSRGFDSFLHLFMEEDMAAYPAEITGLVDDAVRELKLKRKPRILMRKDVLTPYVGGAFRYTLFLPDQWNIPRQVYYMVIKHELAHIRNRDLLFQRLSTAARVFSWFNPFLALMCSRMEEFQEMAADRCACNGASEEECLAYQALLKKLSDIFSNLPHMPVIGLVLKRKKKNQTEERILVMKNRNLYKRKPAKLAVTALMTAVLCTFSAVPALAYTLPSTIEGGNLTTDAIDTIELNVLSSDNDNTQAPDSLHLSEDELFLFLKNYDFSESDFVCIDENGSVTNSMIEPRIIPCNHNYLAALASHHTKNPDGSCITRFYNAKKCSKCMHIVIMEETGNTTYYKCPH